MARSDTEAWPPCTEARDRRLGREVAIKVIHRHLRENPEVARRFASEALAVAKLKHPNIVEVYDVSADDEPERYLVVELVSGVTLRQRLRELGPFPPEIAAAIAREVCDALSQAHRHGVIHRDVKPENVLLRLDGGTDGENTSARVKLTDFGIAKLLDAQGVTHTGQVLGSPAHMAPEQIEGGEVDARADVFGTGVLLYEMLTGTLPFEGQNPAQVLRRVLDGTFLPAERVRPRVGAAYGRIVARALARDPADRYPSAQAFALALEAERSARLASAIRLPRSTASWPTPGRTRLGTTRRLSTGSRYGPARRGTAAMSSKLQLASTGPSLIARTTPSCSQKWRA